LKGGRPYLSDCLLTQTVIVVCDCFIVFSIFLGTSIAFITKETHRYLTSEYQAEGVNRISEI